MPFIRNFLIQEGEIPEGSRAGKFSYLVFHEAVLPEPLTGRLLTNNAARELLTYSGLIDFFHNGRVGCLFSGR